MLFKYLVFFSIAVWSIQAIYLPLKAERPRCLVEFSIGQVGATIKLKISFPNIDKIESGEHFTVTMRNSETNQVKKEVIQPGFKFHREEELDSNVIYEVCVTLKSDREIEVHVEYESESRYDYKHEEIVVPQSLLTKGDMKEAFMSAAYIANIINEYDQVQKQRDGIMEADFKQTNFINGQLTFVAGVEIVVILAAGLYQFFKLKNYLSTRQYI